MSRTKDGLSRKLLLALAAGLAWSANGCNEASVVRVEAPDAGPTVGGAGGSSVSGGSTATGGSVGAPSGGNIGAGGAVSAGGMTTNGGSAAGGSVAFGGQTSAGGAGAGGTSSTADAGPSPGVQDAAADHMTIPDLGSQSDGAATFWPAALPANCTPSAIGGRAQTDGHHRAGEDCMRSGCHLNPKRPEHHAGTDCRGSGCHANGSPDGSGAPAFLFGGTVYRAVTLAADPGVQVGVKATQGFYSACSASNGNFWVIAPSGTTALTWSSAKVRLRNANGEAPMMTPAAAGCNATACHTGTLKMTSP